MRHDENFQHTRDEVFSALCESLWGIAPSWQNSPTMRAQHSASLSARFNDVETATRQMISTEERLVGAQMQVFHAMSQTSEHFRIDPNCHSSSSPHCFPTWNKRSFKITSRSTTSRSRSHTSSTRCQRLSAGSRRSRTGQETGGTYGRDGRRAGRKARQAPRLLDVS